jgi:two-component system, NarL family, response regulator DegU
MTIKVLLADDHTMLREGLRRSMEAAGFDVVGEAGDGDEAISLATELDPDVILMDVSMPVTDGIEATRTLVAQSSRAAVVMLTMHADADVLARAVRAGAAGYLVKDCSTDEIVRVVSLAAEGATALTPELAASMLSEVDQLPGRDGGNDGAISKREVEVLQLIAEGLSTPEVADKLFISVKTVKNHLASIYQKLDSRDRTQAVLRAVRMGIIRLH